MISLIYLRIALWAAIVAGLGFVEYRVYSYGYNRAAIVYKQATDKEIAREHQINEEALKEANHKIQNLQDVTLGLNESLNQAHEAASKDRDANRRAIDAAGVRRLRRGR